MRLLKHLDLTKHDVTRGIAQHVDKPDIAGRYGRIEAKRSLVFRKGKLVGVFDNTLFGPGQSVGTGLYDETSYKPELITSCAEVSAPVSEM